MKPSAVKNAADPEQVAEAGRKERTEDERAADDLTMVMGTAPGRRMVKRLLDHANAFRMVFHENALQMARNAGKQEIGQYWIAQLNNACPEHFLTMMQEYTQQEAKE